MTPVQETIVKEVNKSQGIKSVDLILKVMSSHQDIMKGKELLGIIEQLVKDGDIIEVEYILPEMEYRVKSFYLPKGTKVRLL